MTKRHLALAALVLVAALVPVAAGSTGAQSNSSGEAYTGSHVSFTANDSAVVGYAVDGDTVVSRLAVQSEGEVESELGLGVSADLESTSSIAGAALSVESSTSAAARMRVASGATVEAHDHARGTLVVEADSPQYVELGVNASSRVESESDARAVIETDNGTTASVLVVGNGSVAVNDEGNLTANVESDARLVVRSYTEARTEGDRETESMIVNGTVAAEVYADEQDGERTANAITYDANTSVTVDASGERSVDLTIDRSEHDGKVVLASASAIEADSNEDLTVRVDGDAAAAASTYSELRAAADGGATSKYMVRGDAEAGAEVLVAVNHFSERTVSMAETDDTADDSDDSDTADDSDDSDTGDSETVDGSEGDDTGDSADTGVETTADADAGDEETDSGTGPGFGVIGALLALLGVGLFEHRR